MKSIKDKTPLGRLKRWKTMMNFRLPLLDHNGHFDRNDMKELVEIIEAWDEEIISFQKTTCYKQDNEECEYSQSYLFKLKCSDFPEEE